MYRQSIFNYASLYVWLILIIILFPTIICIFYNTSFLLEWTLLSSNTSPLILTIIADKISLSFSCVVLFISANVLFFSSIYIIDDKFKPRFTILVLLFILSINLLIFLPHLIILLLGWDGLGLVSFILVIYYQNPSSIAASLLTALTNRLGDVAILLAIAITINQGHWFIINIYETSWLPFQVILITLAAITKSAQIPFSSWLPAAMAAPTPVSALVHSSTLVTAGVFLLIRFYPILHQWPFFNKVIIIVATSTTFIAGLRANTECDFKKIVALSTLRQLGIIIFRLGLNMPILAYFHIVTHALFKALLFICVGSFINYHRHTQDLRWIGNLTHQIPLIITSIILANLALCGFPFLAGFYSKDIIIESILTSRFNIIILLITLTSLGLTAFYSIRATMVAIISHQINLPFFIINEPKNISKAVIFLSLCAIRTGRALAWINSSLTTISSTLSSSNKLLPTILIILGGIIAWALTSSISKISNLIQSPIINYARCIIWFIVPLSTQFTIKFPFFITHNLIKSIDQGWLEQTSNQGINKLITNISNTTITYSPQISNSYLIVTILAISRSLYLSLYIY